MTAAMIAVVVATIATAATTAAMTATMIAAVATIVTVATTAVTIAVTAVAATAVTALLLAGAAPQWSVAATVVTGRRRPGGIPARGCLPGTTVPAPLWMIAAVAPLWRTARLLPGVPPEMMPPTLHLVTSMMLLLLAGPHPATRHLVTSLLGTLRCASSMTTEDASQDKQNPLFVAASPSLAVLQLHASPPPSSSPHPCLHNIHVCVSVVICSIS
mmetsp:Transcript_32273/g.80850  ORF Transcript_32273/g.80850 Transcript_32273/m.80850 type:complete len:215 (-) Transcript_32273:1096-1740(-)